MVERQEGNYGRANELFEEANRLNPGNPVVLRAWARMKAETGAIEESRKLAQEGLEAAPDDPANLHNLAVTESQAGNYEKANQLLEKATYPSPVSPQQERQNLMTFGAKAENFRRWGVTLLNQAKLPEAREKLSLGMEAATNGLRINTSEWKLKEIQIRLFLNLGEVVLRQGDLPGAEKLLRKAFFYNPQTPWQFRHNSDACLALARCLRELGLTEEAVRYCQMGLRAWPGNETLRRFYETLPRKK
jgi:hypothetical protein